MDKKIRSILGSILVIAVVIALMTVGTKSYFSDIETSPGNTFTAGTIDLTVNGKNPLEEAVVTIQDMKPCKTFYVEKILHIYGNPADVWLHIKIYLVIKEYKQNRKLKRKIKLELPMENAIFIII